MKIIQGDCVQVLKQLEENSVDSIVTDPPAGISFMGKSWDTDKGGRDNWIKWMSEIATECIRVLKPGGHAFVWTIPKTSHWTATAWENSGFEIRDVVAHIFGSGFPKSLNIGKAVDKLQGNEREDLGPRTDIHSHGANCRKNDVIYPTKEPRATKGTSEWEGWGTALKPAREDWLLMRKPLSEKTVAENCLKWKTSGINIDGCRVETTDKLQKLDGTFTFSGGQGADTKGKHIEFVDSGLGRFPANLIHDNSEEVRECFPESNSGNGKASTYEKFGGHWGKGKQIRNEDYGDSGNASRFFKSIPIEEQDEIQEECTSMEEKLEKLGLEQPKSIIYQSKASKRERNKGCEELDEREVVRQGLAGEHNNPTHKNNHPTVKPIALMEYLIKMITHKGGIVLDPFSGSGSTLVAAKENGFDFIGIEKEPEYIKIIEARTGIKAEVFESKEVKPEIKQEIKKIETPKKTGLSKCCNAKIIKGYCEKCCELVK